MAAAPSRSRRALALGPLDIAAAIDLLIEHHAVARRGLRALGEVVEMHARCEHEQIDVTSFGSAMREYMPGLARMIIEIDLIVAPDVDFINCDRLEFHEQVGDLWVEGELLVVRCDVRASVGSLVTARLCCVSAGPFRVSPDPAQQPARAGSPSAGEGAAARRGIALEGVA